MVFVNMSTCVIFTVECRFSEYKLSINSRSGFFLCNDLSSSTFISVFKFIVLQITNRKFAIFSMHRITVNSLDSTLLGEVWTLTD